MQCGKVLIGKSKEKTVANYRIELSPQAKSDLKKIRQSRFSTMLDKIIRLIVIDPYQTAPPVKTLTGNLKGYLSRRINVQHRLVYKIETATKVIKIISCWSYYHE
jgi:Txe/YoeB family toxin of toxin-antitoxin system